MRLGYAFDGARAMDGLEFRGSSGRPFTYHTDSEAKKATSLGVALSGLKRLFTRQGSSKCLAFVGMPTPQNPSLAYCNISNGKFSGLAGTRCIKEATPSRPHVSFMCHARKCVATCGRKVIESGENLPPNEHCEVSKVNDVFHSRVSPGVSRRSRGVLVNF